MGSGSIPRARKQYCVRCILYSLPPLPRPFLRSPPTPCAHNPLPPPHITIFPLHSEQVPIRIAFDEAPPAWEFVIDSLADGFYIVDIVFNFRIAYVDPISGTMIIGGKRCVFAVMAEKQARGREGARARGRGVGAVGGGREIAGVREGKERARGWWRVARLCMCDVRA